MSDFESSPAGQFDFVAASEMGIDPDLMDRPEVPSCEPWLISTDDAPGWNEFFDAEPLRRWAQEVRRCLDRPTDAREWRLVGPRIAIEHEDREEAVDLLRCTAREAGLGFARVPPRGVVEISRFVRAPFMDDTPVLVTLDWGNWAVGEDDDSRAFASSMRQQLQQFNPEVPIFFAVCTRSVDQFTEDFRKVGAFDRVFALQEPTSRFLGERFLRLFGSEEIDVSLGQAPHKVGLILKNEFRTRDAQALAALALQRAVRRMGRPARLTDLTDLALRGTHESTSPHGRPAGEDSRRRTAFHEAGHACIAVIASAGVNIPDYASIVPARGFDGVVIESLSFADVKDDFTFENLLLRTRIALAGRAGEELAFGPQKVSSGADSDLMNATDTALSHFAHSGFHPGMERGESSGLHLAVLPRGQEVDPFQANRLHREVRRFLASQYAYVMKELTTHRAFLEAVAARLLWDPVIDQQEMSELAVLHGLPLREPPTA